MKCSLTVTQQSFVFLQTEEKEKSQTLLKRLFISPLYTLAYVFCLAIRREKLYREQEENYHETLRELKDGKTVGKMVI